MAKIIAFYNNKGGVAKTTTATNVAGVLSLQHKRVLLIDGDPQGHTSLTFGVDADDLQTTLGAYLVVTGTLNKLLNTLSKLMIILMLFQVISHCQILLFLFQQKIQNLEINILKISLSQSKTSTIILFLIWRQPLILF